jgi:hypothetical protein
VVVTGNHFIVDGLVALILLAVAVAVTVSIPSQRPERFVRLLARQHAGRAGPAAS